MYICLYKYIYVHIDSIERKTDTGVLSDNNNISSMYVSTNVNSNNNNNSVEIRKKDVVLLSHSNHDLERGKKGAVVENNTSASNNNNKDMSPQSPRYTRTSADMEYNNNNGKNYSDHSTSMIPLSVSVSPQRLIRLKKDVSTDKVKASSRIRTSQEIRKSSDSVEVCYICYYIRI
jgi:hypothetical protein